MFKVGVIGAGSMGRHHVRIFAGMAECSLLGVSDPDGTRAELAQEHGTKYFSDQRELLALKPDLLSIAAPTSLHYEIAKDALEAGCNLLIEKPVTDKLDTARELIALAKARGKLLSVGHIERFNPAVVALKGLVEAGDLGDVLNLSNLRAGPYHGRSLDVGIILDLATHDVDMQAWLMGARATHVYATSMRRVHNHEDHAVLHLRLADGRTGVIEESWNAPYRERYVQVFGTKHMAVADLIAQTVTIYDPNPDGHPPLPREHHVEKGEPLAAELRDVVLAVATGEVPRCTAEDSVYALEVCLAALKSCETGQAVRIG